MQLPDIPRDKPVLIAGPTACGKSDLALEIARRDGGQIINADASQVYDCWRVITARPSREDEKAVPHALYGHVKWSMPYSAGHWLRDVASILKGPRPIIVGGTGLYFSALTQGMAEIPPIPAPVRTVADTLTLQELTDALDERSLAQLDTRNRARVQRAYEVMAATGRTLIDWQSETPAPLLPVEDCFALVLDAPRDWLLDRINRRFDKMLENGALEEVQIMQHYYDPSLSSFKAIGVPELMAHLRGDLTLNQAREKVSVATRQFAKRQRTWFRSGKMADWMRVDPSV